MAGNQEKLTVVVNCKLPRKNHDGRKIGREISLPTSPRRIHYIFADFDKCRRRVVAKERPVLRFARLSRDFVRAIDGICRRAVIYFTLTVCLYLHYVGVISI